MDVREKLVELLTGHSIDTKTDVEYVADHLIAHGVTVQDKTEISDELLERLRNAPVMAMTEEPNVEVVQDSKGVEIDPFNEWISVKDRLPKGADGKSLCENVLAYFKNGEIVGQVCTGWLNGDNWYLTVGDDDHYTVWELGAVTHWMPLPQPPKGE